MTRSRSVNLFDLFILFVVCVSLSSILLLVLNRYHPYYALAAGLFIVVVSIRLAALTVNVRLRGIPLGLVMVLILAVIFRADPYLFVPGGQDQGVYVNMSATYERTGKTFITDDVRQRAISAGVEDWYDAANQLSVSPNLKPGKFEGIHLPGVYIADLDRSEYVYQFYPMHPLWMALAGKLLGEKHRVYSLVFFSLLSITAVYLLAGALPGGGPTSSLLAGIFLALNPLHAFFSKFPVSEVVALCFSSLGFYYLIRYYILASAGKSDLFCLVVSSGLFGCMFFTRISSFLLLPFFYVFMLIALVFEERRLIRKHLCFFFLSVFGWYGFSILYGTGYSYPYTYDIYNIFFGRTFGSAWLVKLVLIGCGAAAFLLAVFWMRRAILTVFLNKAILRWLRQHMDAGLCMILGVVILLAGYKAYQLGFTPKYTGGQNALGGLGWNSVMVSNLFVTVIYLSPVGFGIFAYGIMRGVFSPNRGVTWTGLLFFLALMWCIFGVIQFMTRYQYYYARYLVSEVVPYTLLAIAVLLGNLFDGSFPRKITAICSAVVMALFFLYFSLYQFQGKSADGAYASLNQITEKVESNDLVLLYRIAPPLEWILKTPLSLFYGLNTCNLKRLADLQDPTFRKFLETFDDLFLISTKRPQSAMLTPIKKITYKEGEFRKSKGLPPRAYRYHCEDLTLYQVDKSALMADVISPIEMKGHLSNFHDGLWTNGSGVIHHLSLQLKPKHRYIRIHTGGRNPLIHRFQWAKLRVYLNGVEQEYCSKRGNAFTFRISGGIDVIREIRIRSATVVPREEGISDDARRLGIDVDSIEWIENNDDHMICPVELKEDLGNFYEGIWTNGNGIIRNINYEVNPSHDYISIHVKGWHPLMHDTKWPIPQLYINGMAQTFHSKTRKSYLYRISPNVQTIRDIRIASATFVPKEVGLNDDTRRLGVDVDAIVITKNAVAF